jgi:hypothetical protein
MPFKSKDQAWYFYFNKPKVYKEFKQHTKSMKNLPEKVDKKKNYT